MADPRLPKDHEQRRGAVFTRTHAFVWAGAGTGKTTVLTLRAFNLILRTPFHERLGEETSALYGSATRAEALAAGRRAVRSVALITFTRKAAAEMKDRLFGFLNALASLPEQEFRERFAQSNPLLVEVVDRVLEEIRALPGPLPENTDPFGRLRAGAAIMAELAPELQISTIHSYAARILQRNPLEARLPRDVVFAEEDNPLQSDISQGLINRWLERRVLEEPDLRKALESVLRVTSLDNVRQWLEAIHRNPWVVEELSDWRRDLEDATAGSTLAAAIRELHEKFKPTSSSTIMLRYHSQWAEIARRLEKGDNSAWLDPGIEAAAGWNHYFGKTSLRNKAQKYLPSQICELLLDKARLTGAVYLNAMREGVDGPFKAWMKLNRAFRRWCVGAELRELKVVTFDEMVRLAARTLERHPNLVQRECGELQALLMDEFQDTDPDQIKLVRQLLLADSGKKHDVLGFFVGDEKQSIYRFRGVDLAHIHEFQRDCRQEHWKGRVETFSLSTNFRCNPQILEYVNAGFRPLFDKKPGIQCEPQELAPHRQEPRIDPVLVNVNPAQLGLKADAGTARDLAANEVIQQIHDYMNQADGRAYSDVMVLVRANHELETLLPKLTEAGIPAVSTGTQTYYGNPEVLDLLNLLIVLHNPTDTVAAAAVLRSPFVCISDTDLHQIIRQELLPRCFDPDNHPALDHLPDRARTRIRRIQELAALRRNEPLSSWLRMVKRFVPWPLYAREDDLEARFFVRFKTLLRAYRDVVTSGAVPPLTWLLAQRKRAAVAGDWDADLGEDVTVTDEAVDAVRAMTIHKAKGLEARFVLVYGWAGPLKDMDAGERNPKDGVITACDLGPKGTLRESRALKKNWGPIGIQTRQYADAKTVAAMHDRAEAVRLAYVAATRARDRLTLILAHHASLNLADPALALCGLKDGTPAPQPLEVATISDSILTVPKRHDPRTPPVFGKAYLEHWKRQRLRCEELTDTKLILTPTAEQAHLPEPAPAAARQTKETSSDTARLRGILVHAYLEHYLTDNTFHSEKLKHLARRKSESLPEQAVEEAASVLEGFYSGATKDSRGQPYHDRVSEARILGREIPIYMTHAGRAWTGVIDLVLEEEERILAVDYKTGALLDAESEKRRYGKQREIYTEAVRRLFKDRAVDFEIFWLGT